MVTRALSSATAYLRALSTDGAQAWDAFWFTPADPINLGVIRILLGALLLYTHITALPDLLEYIGPSGWVDQAALHEMWSLPFNPADPGSGRLGSGTQSLWFYVQTPALIWAGQALFLLAIVCFTIGCATRVATILVWLGHMSYVQRGTVIAFGMDSIIAMLTLYLIFAPAGATLSIDRWRAGQPASPSVAANFVLRLIQVHLCLIYLFSGLSKLHGASWWNGTALYQALMISETSLFDLAWLARPEWLWLIVSNLGGFFTLAIELGFPVFIWNRRLRPLVLALVVFMQLTTLRCSAWDVFSWRCSPRSWRFFRRAFFGAKRTRLSWLRRERAVGPHLSSEQSAAGTVSAPILLRLRSAMPMLTESIS